MGTEAEEILKKLPDLIRKDEEFRIRLFGIFVEHFPVREEYIEILRKLEEHDKKFEEMLAELREHRKILERHDKKLEGHDKKFEEIVAELKEHRRILEKHDKKF